MFNNKTKTEKIPRQMPALRPDVAGEPSSPVQYASRSRRLSEEAALAAQHVLDMEHELRGVTAERDEQIIAREVVDRENARLKETLDRLAAQHETQLARMSADRDYHRERHVEIATRLNSVAAMLVSEVEQPKPEMPPAPPTAPGSLEEEIARMAEEATRQ